MSATAAKTIGSFQVEGELRSGGMGVVYLARHPVLERPAVLKRLRRALADDPTLEERFRREAQAAAGVHHQNVVAVYDCFTWRGDLFIAQEFVDGGDLAEVLLAVQRLPARIAGLVALEMLRGLEEVHERGVVHRDLKPANVLLGRRGEVKLADFGISRSGKGASLTQTGHAVGTPLYMAPEQLRGENVDHRSDLFSVAVVIYEMLTGRTPFGGEEPEEERSLLKRIEGGHCVRPRKLAPGTPRRLERLILACLRAKRKRRPASTRELRQGIEALLGGPSSRACRDEIADWLAEKRLFTEGDRTVRRPKQRSEARPPRLWLRRLGWAAAALLYAALLAGATRIDLGPLLSEESLSRAVALAAPR